MVSNKSPINWRTFLLCVTISLGQMVGAYNSVIIGTTLQKADFMQRMGLWDSEGNSLPNSSAREGAIVGLFQVLPFIHIYQASTYCRFKGRGSLRQPNRCLRL